MKLEICIDHLESMDIAAANGADRIELCASLAEGGLTPPMSMIRQALARQPESYVMVRPRACDFLYSEAELAMMRDDIEELRRMACPGVVFGVLTADGDLDETAMRMLVEAAGEMQVTCHRAVDQARDIFQALDVLIELGVSRVLSSGQAETPVGGRDLLARMVAHADGRIGIMAAGVRPDSVRALVQSTGVNEVHASASVTTKSRMHYFRGEAKMGALPDFEQKTACAETVQALREAVRDL